MTYFFLRAGGGVPGRDVGIAPVTMTGDGFITGESHLFTDTFLPVGETITEIVNGKAIGGNIREFRIGNFKETGAHGNVTGTGRNVSTGEFRDCMKEGIPQRSG